MFDPEATKKFLQSLPSKEYARMEALEPNNENNDELVFPESSTTEFLLERQGKLLIALQTELLNFDMKMNVKDYVALTTAFERHMTIYHMIGGAFVDTICNENFI